jgi:hypothetical protein
MIFRNAPFTVLAIVLLSGCVNTRPLGQASQLAVEQRVTLIERAKYMYIYYVDDNHRGYGSVEKFQITPGVHTVTFTGMTNGYMVGTTSAKMKLTYNFAPGHTYMIRDAASGGPFAVQIIDQATGAELHPQSGT